MRTPLLLAGHAVATAVHLHPGAVGEQVCQAITPIARGVCRLRMGSSFSANDLRDTNQRFGARSLRNRALALPGKDAVSALLEV